MLRVMLCGACLLGMSGMVAGAPKQLASADQGRASCDAKYYRDLVGRGIDEARAIQGVDYRLVRSDSARGEANPKRMTIVYDSRSNQITEVACG